MPKTCSRVWKDLRRVFKSYGYQNHQFFRACGWTATNSLDPWKSHPAKSLSAVRVPSNIAFQSNRSHSSQISTASHLYLSACTSLWQRPVRAILYTWLTSLHGTDDLYDATLECARSKYFPAWRKITNYRLGIFNFDAELEWCNFRALTVHVLYPRQGHLSCVHHYSECYGCPYTIKCMLLHDSGKNYQTITWLW